VSRLAGKRVLVTRPRGDADELAAKLLAAGAEPLLAPAIEFGPPDDAAAALAAVRAGASYDWIAFTSVHGVEAFFSRLEELGKLPERASASASAAEEPGELPDRGGSTRRDVLGEARIAAIGPKTASAVERHGVVPDFVPARAINEEIAAGLLERTQPGSRVLIFRAQEAREILPALLREAGRAVDDVAAYATRSVVDPALAEAARAADVWTFTSASTVHGLLANLPDAAAVAPGKLVACIGPVTAAAAEAAGLPVHVTAAAYSVAGLIAALEGSGSPA
jgi:uroporphyrinogen III methyltransferase/synthase